MQIVSIADLQWIFPFTVLKPSQFRRLVRLVAERGASTVVDGGPGHPWSLPLADRVSQVATHLRTNLTLRQVGPLFGMSYSAAYRIIDSLTPLLALVGPPAADRPGHDRRRRPDPDTRPPAGRAVEEPPLLDEPAGRR